MGMYRVRVVTSGYPGGPGLNTFYFDSPAGGSVGDATLVANRVRAAFATGPASFPTGTTIQVQPAVDFLEPLNGQLLQSFGIVPPAPVLGTGVGTYGPLEVAAGLILDTGLAINGRRLKGRAFISGFIAAAFSAAAPPASVNTFVNAFGVALIGVAPPLAPAPCVVWRRPKGVTSGLVRPVLLATVAPKWWVLRSRRD